MVLLRFAKTVICDRFSKLSKRFVEVKVQDTYLCKQFLTAGSLYVAGSSEAVEKHY